MCSSASSTHDHPISQSPGRYGPIYLQLHHRHTLFTEIQGRGVDIKENCHTLITFTYDVNTVAILVCARFGRIKE